MRIVLVMIEPPLPFGDAAARLYYVIMKALVRNGHRVTAFATCSKPEQMSRAKAIFPEPTYDLRCYPNPRRHGLSTKLHTLASPYSFMFADQLRADLHRELSAGFDVLHLEQLSSGWMGLEHAERSLLGVHYLFSIDLRAVPVRTLRDLAQRFMMLRAERYLLRSFRFFRACTPRLVDPIRRLNPSADIASIPIGLDPGLYPYVPDARRAKQPIVTLIGSMRWHPTISGAIRMLTRLYPEIKRKVPDVRFQIVGWSARSVLRQYLSLPDVEVFENVPETKPFFENASVLLYPATYASGIKIKVLEAMAFGLPVVTTSDGVEGLSASDGEHAGIAEDDEGLIDRTVALLTNQNLQNRQRKAARELLEARCDLRYTADSLEHIYENVVSSNTPVASTISQAGRV